MKNTTIIIVLCLLTLSVASCESNSKYHHTSVTHKVHNVSVTAVLSNPDSWEGNPKMRLTITPQEDTYIRVIGYGRRSSELTIFEGKITEVKTVDIGQASCGVYVKNEQGGVEAFKRISLHK